ncbi:MAG: pseudouridine synthase [Lachnospiraceae bacterium]|nr:pseudouridine synthase [Lachnospiraceae bacterium]
MRLDKFLADMSVGTRTEIRKMVRKGAVTVDGETARDAGMSVDPDRSAVVLNGSPVVYRHNEYYMMNKPAGVLTATEDKRQRTVLDLMQSGGMRKEHGLPDAGENQTQSGSSALSCIRRDISPVGRLDKDTEGLLILTNDGQLAHRLLAPKSHVDKVYYAEIAGRIGQRDIQRFREGIRFDEDLTAMPAKMELLGVERGARTRQSSQSTADDRSKTAPAQADPASGTGESAAAAGVFSKVLITIHEGKFHQIKKMVEALGDGKRVLYLKRVKMGGLSLDETLQPGEWRELTPEEISSLEEKESGV